VPDVLVSHEVLRAFGTQLLEAAGAPPEAARTTANLLVRADLSGHPSHGVRLLDDFCARCSSGQIDPAATPAIERDDGSTVVVDARRALGQVAGLALIELGVERAKRHGAAVLTMRRSGSVGRLADYVEHAADAGIIALVAANDSGANEVVAPHGSHEARLATNPIAVGIPRSTRPHLVLDMATSVVSHGTLELRRASGQPIPEGWTAGDALVPLGGPKGTGLALVVDVLAGVLSGAGFSRGEPADDYQGVWMLALDPGRFLDADDLSAKVERLVDHVQSATPLAGVEVLVPGEAGARLAAGRRSAGVPLAPHVWNRLCSLADDLDVTVPPVLLGQ
jgi:hydroxycarboxylate dehydrogenase B